MKMEKLNETLSKAFEVKENAATESNEMNSLDGIFGDVAIPVEVDQNAPSILDGMSTLEDEINEALGGVVDEKLQKEVKKITTGACQEYLDAKKSVTPVNEELDLGNASLKDIFGIDIETIVEAEEDEKILDSNDVNIEKEELQPSVDVESKDGNTAEVVKDKSNECEPSQEKAATEAESEEKQRAKEAAKRKALEDDFKKERQEAIERLRKRGITIDEKLGKVKLTTSLDGEYTLFMKAIKPRKSSLVYKLYEVDTDGVSDEMENFKDVLKQDDVENSNTKVVDIIGNLQGYYAPISSDIKTDMAQIAKYRLLKPVVADTDVLTGQQIVELLKKWFEDHITDVRVAIFEMGGCIHAAIVKRGEKTPYKIFAEIMSEIAPANKVLAIKDWMRENNMFVHDSNEKCKDNQKTLSRSVMEQIGATSDKCISFNFGQEYIEYLYEEYMMELDIGVFSVEDNEFYIIDEREAS